MRYILAFLATLVAPGLQAQILSPSAIATEHTRATLLTEATAAAPGASFWVALKLDIDPG